MTHVITCCFTTTAVLRHKPAWQWQIVMATLLLLHATCNAIIWTPFVPALEHFSQQLWVLVVATNVCKT